jgi:putative membrane protein insertion efficiency factor
LILAVRRVAWRAGAPLRWGLIGLVQVYRVTLSGVLGGQCRFHPSCSQYARDAIRNAGAVRGTALAVWRVLRCSPLTAGGVDLPPERRYDNVIHSGESSAPEEVRAA